MSMGFPLLTYCTIVVASVGTSVVVTDYSDRQDDALKIQIEKREDAKRTKAINKVCRETRADRRILIRKGRVEARGNEAIANDPTSSPRARQIRSYQAKIEREAVADLRKRVKRADCKTK